MTPSVNGLVSPCASAPHFIDFGNNLKHSPDGKAYLVGHGAVASDSQPRPCDPQLDHGDQIYLARVEPGVNNMNDRSRYEFFAGRDRKDRAQWTSDFRRIQPVIEWNNRAGCVRMSKM